MSGGAVSNQSIMDFRERNRNRTQTPAPPSAVLPEEAMPGGGENLPPRGIFLGPARDMARFSPTDIGRGGGGVGSGGRPVTVPGADPFGGGGSTTPLVPGAGSPGPNPRPGPVFGPAPTHRPPPVDRDPERPVVGTRPGDDEEAPPFFGHGPDPGGGGGGGGGTSPGPTGGGTGGTGGAPDRRSLANLGITQLAPGFRARRQRRSRSAQTIGG